MFNLKKNKKGFTLVELMVVVVIIGILTAIAIPVYNAVTASAQEKTCKANQRSIDSAINVAIADEKHDITEATTIANLVEWGYLAEEPFCPADKDDPKNSYSIIKTDDGSLLCKTNCDIEGHDLHTVAAAPNP